MNGREPGYQHLPIGSGEISTSKETLCDKCLAISWEPDGHVDRHTEGGYIGWTFDHHETFGDLEASCEAGCPLCQTFFLLLTYDSLGLRKGDPLHWSLLLTAGHWHLCFETQRLDRIDKRGYTFVDPTHIPSQTVTSVKGFKPSGLTNDLRALLDESIKPWLEACLCPWAHMNCPNLPPNEEVSYRMPTRLIDVGSERQPKVKLITSDDLSECEKRSPYLILSYQWGKGNDSARTTTKNIEERSDEIIFQQMPKTIRDAIDITRLVGIRYLWVDAVCIIQADICLGPQQQNDVAKADWEKESMNMTAYYSNALCCIAAASAKDSSEGILNERQVARYGYKEWRNPANLVLASPHALRRRVESSLLSRGWCLQEWLLSPRILHWTSHGLIWQCSHGFFWEGQSGFQGETPEAAGGQRLGDYDRFTNDCILHLGFSQKDTSDICQILHCEERDSLGKAWSSLVSQFVRMNLSFSTDRLAAIQGIATRLSERHGVEYFAGVFRSHCVEHLLWHVMVQRTSLESVDTFPTWSWASSPGIVYFLPDFKMATSLISDLQPFPSAQNQRNSLSPTNKELCFTAPLVKLGDLELEDKCSPGEPEGSRYVFGVGSPVWAGLTMRLYLDSSDTPLPLTDRAYLLVLQYTPGYYQGLVVQKATNEKKVDPRNNVNVFKRLGMFDIQYVVRRFDLRRWESKVIMI